MTRLSSADGNTRRQKENTKNFALFHEEAGVLNTWKGKVKDEINCQPRFIRKKWLQDGVL